MVTILAMTIGLCFISGTLWAAETEKSNTGFLTDYSKLERDPMNLVDMMYIKEDTDWKTYNKLMLDDVVFFIDKDADFKGLAAAEMADLGKAFHQAVIINLQSALEFTDTPGPGVMRLRFAITNLKPNNPITGAATTILPVGLALSGVKKAVTGTHIGMASVSVEGEIIDSQSGEVLGAMMDRKMGEKHKITKTLTKWGHVYDMFNEWARNLRTRLDKVLSESN